MEYDRNWSQEGEVVHRSSCKVQEKIAGCFFFVSRLRKEMRRISSKRHDHVKAMQGDVLKRFSVCKMYVKLFDIFVP